MNIIVLYIWFGIFTVITTLIIGKQQGKVTATIKDVGGQFYNFMNFLPGELIIPGMLIYQWFFSQSAEASMFFPALSWLQVLGFAVSLISLGIYISSILIMKKNWTTGLELRKDHTLVDRGAYKYIRHPIYTAWFGIIFSIALMLESMCFAFIFIPVFAWYYHRACTEEQFLAENLTGYQEYLLRTKRFIPLIV